MVFLKDLRQTPARTNTKKNYTSFFSIYPYSSGLGGGKNKNLVVKRVSLIKKKKDFKKVTSLFDKMLFKIYH